MASKLYRCLGSGGFTSPHSRSAPLTALLIYPIFPPTSTPSPEKKFPKVVDLLQFPSIRTLGAILF